MTEQNPPLDIRVPADGSDKEFLFVTLSVADWRLMAENLYHDAEAEPDGAADLPCHISGPATERCADTIMEALHVAGWDK